MASKAETDKGGVGAFMSLVSWRSSVRHGVRCDGYCDRSACVARQPAKKPRKEDR